MPKYINGLLGEEKEEQKKEQEALLRGECLNVCRWLYCIKSPFSYRMRVKFWIPTHCEGGQGAEDEDGRGRVAIPFAASSFRMSLYRLCGRKKKKKHQMYLDVDKFCT